MSHRRRVRTPTVIQMEAAECGAAALAMVLGYYGRHVPLEELRVACGVSRDGSKALNIVRAARGFGLLSKGYRKEPVQLRDLALPFIAFWNFNHFVVVEGFDRDRAYVNDPGFGPRALPATEFDESYTGVVLLFEKGPDFRPGGERPSVLAALASRLPGSRRALLFTVLATLALVVPGLVGPAYSRVFLDEVIVGGKSAWAYPLMLAMVVTSAVAAWLTYLQQRSLLRLEMRLAIDASARFLLHVLRLPMQFFAQRFSGDIVSRIETNDTIAALLSGELATNVVNVAMLAFFAALMARYDLTLAALAVAVAALNALALRAGARRRKDTSVRMLQERGRLVGASMAGLQNLESLRASGAESEFFGTWAGHQARVVSSEAQLAHATIVLAAVPPLLTALGGAAVIGLGGVRIVDGALTMGMLLAFQLLWTSFMIPVNRLSALGGVVQEAGGHLNRLDDVLRYPEDPGASPLEAGLPNQRDRLDGAIELRHVTFGYSRLDPPLITDFSLSIAAGRRVALVGGSGSGKSTIARIVLGLYRPWEGDVLFDGVERDRVSRDAIANSVALVDQDITLFEGTVRDNLTLWDPALDDDALAAAAQDACIHDDIVARPGGYGGSVEEQGRNFSGGQRQRLEIARALARNPQVLVLDEATSALDPLTEQAVDDAVRRRGCTCLIVAHRLSTIRDCDEIVVLDQGTVVERGRHDELMAHEGHYARLVRAS